MDTKCEIPNIKLENITNETGKIADMVYKRGMANTSFAYNMIMSTSLVIVLIAMLWRQDEQIEKRDKILSSISSQMEKQQSALEKLNEKIDKVATRDRESFFKEIGQIEMYNEKTGEIEKWRFKP